MREHLYRGKRVDNGEWVEGGITFDMSGTLYICPARFSDYNEEIEVIPETVGEYTGLTDKNGKKIFEGDIHQYENKYFVVKFGVFVDDDMDCNGYGYYMEEITPVEGYTYKRQWSLYAPDNYVEIVGNIHDNPEFLETK